MPTQMWCEIAIECVSKDMENPSPGVWHPNAPATRPLSLRPRVQPNAGPSLKVKLSTLAWPGQAEERRTQGAGCRTRPNAAVKSESCVDVDVGVTQRNRVACVTEMWNKQSQSQFQFQSQSLGWPTPPPFRAVCVCAGQKCSCSIVTIANVAAVAAVAAPLRLRQPEVVNMHTKTCSRSWTRSRCRARSGSLRPQRMLPGYVMKNQSMRYTLPLAIGQEFLGSQSATAFLKVLLVFSEYISRQIFLSGIFSM